MLLGMGAMLLVMFPFMSWVVRTETKRLVKDSLKIVPNREAAEEWIDKSMRGPQALARPKQVARQKQRILAQIDVTSKEMGIG